MADPAALLDLACRAATRAGDLLLDGQPRVRQSVASKSSPTDMVTEMDTAAERLIVETVAGERPGDAVLGEESGEQSGRTGVRWVIDPLDGTTNYLYGIAQWAVSIAVEIDGDAVAAVVHHPAPAETFTATRGGGAFRNGTALQVRGAPTLASSLVGTGFAYSPERRAHQGAVAARVVPEVRDLRRAGSAALDLCWVAAGRLDAYYERYMGVWDYAAGALIAAEAGAWVGGLDGGPPSATSTVAAPEHLARPLRDLIADAEAEVGPPPP